MVLRQTLRNNYLCAMKKKRVSLLIPLVSWLLSYENRVKMDFATEEAAGMA